MTLRNGTQWGWQAKYTFDIDKALPLMERSLKTVIRERPKCRKLTFCVPFDLPDAPSEGARKSARQKFEDRKKSWRQRVPGASRVRIELWSAGDLLERLVRHPSQRGIARFFWDHEDGNGRLGRLWQTLLLTRWRSLFAHVPVESLVHARQGDYYEAIRRSSAEGESTAFVAFMLEAILAAVRTPQETPQVAPQVARLLSVLEGEMSVREILHTLGLGDRKSLRQRYLLPALQGGYLEMTRPDAPSARNQKYRLTPLGQRVRSEAD